jgi:hypothetical protein
MNVGWEWNEVSGIRGYYDTKINEKRTRDLDTVYWAMNGHDRTVLGLERRVGDVKMRTRLWGRE